MRGMVRWIFRREEWSLCVLYMEGRRVCIGRRWTSVAAAFCCLRLQHWRGGGCCQFLVFIEGGGFHLTAKQLLWIFLILEACQAVFVNDMVATQQRMWHKWGTGVAGGERVLLIFNLWSCHYWLKDECWGYKKLRLPPHLWGIWGLMSNPQ